MYASGTVTFSGTVTPGGFVVVTLTERIECHDAHEADSSRRHKRYARDIVRAGVE